MVLKHKIFIETIVSKVLCGW